MAVPLILQSQKGTRRRKSSKKKKTSCHSKCKSRRCCEQPNFLGNNPSVGNWKKVHDLPVIGKGIDKAAGPLVMHSKDSGELWNTAVSIMVLSGMFKNIESAGGKQQKWWQQ
jgi:hypothetical protein